VYRSRGFAIDAHSKVQPFGKFPPRRSCGLPESAAAAL